MSIKVGADVPDRFEGLHPEEVPIIRFRCPYCGIAAQAAVPPGTPLLAKYHCRQCDRTSEIQTRDSAIQEVENWFEEGKDVRDTLAKKREWSKSTAALVQTKLGPAYLIG